MKPCMLNTLESLQARCVEEGRCWIWQGATDGRGKPSMRSRGKVTNPRRVARALKDGTPLAAGDEVVPLCRNPLCISPACSVKTDHKGWGRIASESGAFCNPAKNRRGAMTKRAKSWITEAMVATIKAAASARKAALLTGVSLSHCKAIRRGTARKDYANPWAGLAAANDSARRTAA